MREFIQAHWGDLIGLGILYTGVGLVIAASDAAGMLKLGEALVLAAMGVLKLRSVVTNGNGAAK